MYGRGGINKLEEHRRRQQEIDNRLKEAGMYEDGLTEEMKIQLLKCLEESRESARLEEEERLSLQCEEHRQLNRTLTESSKSQKTGSGNSSAGSSRNRRQQEVAASVTPNHNILKINKKSRTLLASKAESVHSASSQQTSSHHSPAIKPSCSKDSDEELVLLMGEQRKESDLQVIDNSQPECQMIHSTTNTRLSLSAKRQRLESVIEIASTPTSPSKLTFLNESPILGRTRTDAATTAVSKTLTTNTSSTKISSSKPMSFQVDGDSDDSDIIPATPLTDTTSPSSTPASSNKRPSKPLSPKVILVPLLTRSLPPAKGFFGTSPPQTSPRKDSPCRKQSLSPTNGVLSPRNEPIDKSCTRNKDQSHSSRRSLTSSFKDSTHSSIESSPTNRITSLSSPDIEEPKNSGRAIKKDVADSNMGSRVIKNSVPLHKDSFIGRNTGDGNAARDSVTLIAVESNNSMSPTRYVGVSSPSREGVTSVIRNTCTLYSVTSKDIPSTPRNKDSTSLTGTPATKINSAPSGKVTPLVKDPSNVPLTKTTDTSASTNTALSHCRKQGSPVKADSGTPNHTDSTDTSSPFKGFYGQVQPSATKTRLFAVNQDSSVSQDVSLSKLDTDTDLFWGHPAQTVTRTYQKKTTHTKRRLVNEDQQEDIFSSLHSSSKSASATTTSVSEHEANEGTGNDCVEPTSPVSDIDEKVTLRAAVLNSINVYSRKDAVSKSSVLLQRQYVPSQSTELNLYCNPGESSDQCCRRILAMMETMFQRLEKHQANLPPLPWSKPLTTHPHLRDSLERPRPTSRQAKRCVQREVRQKEETEPLQSCPAVTKASEGLEPQSHTIRTVRPSILRRLGEARVPGLTGTRRTKPLPKVTSDTDSDLEIAPSSPSKSSVARVSPTLPSSTVAPSTSKLHPRSTLNTRKTFSFDIDSDDEYNIDDGSVFKKNKFAPVVRGITSALPTFPGDSDTKEPEQPQLSPAPVTLKRVTRQGRRLPASELTEQASSKHQKINSFIVDNSSRLDSRNSHNQMSHSDEEMQDITELPSLLREERGAREKEKEGEEEKEEKVPCPMCQNMYSWQQIERHASDCMGVDVESEVQQQEQQQVVRESKRRRRMREEPTLSARVREEAKEKAQQRNEVRGGDRSDSPVY